MSAWVVSPGSLNLAEYGSVIAYCETEAEALKIGRKHFDVEDLSLTATRATWADKYAPNQPPAKAWLSAGFCHYCRGCEDSVDEMTTDKVFSSRGDVWCSSACRREERNKQKECA